ncbi:tail fiber assembly protein [Providencia stuartii]|nr:tail fiber assembly protein [Providencia stuartii]
MKYYKNKKTGEVCAYSLEQLDQVLRLSELESIIEVKEPLLIESHNSLQQAESELIAIQDQLNLRIADAELNNDIDNASYDDDINALNLQITAKTEVRDKLISEFNELNLNYQLVKDEFNLVPPVFFEIRENINSMKEMTEKEVNAHLNPPIPKDQLIAEADQQKQSLLVEANNAIAPLQYAENLGIATAEESTSLVDWQKYSVYLNRVDTSLVPDIDWPVKPA